MEGIIFTLISILIIWSNNYEYIIFNQIEQLVRLELPCVKQAIVIGEGQGYLAVLLTLHTNLDEKTKQPGRVLSDDAQRWFKNTRYVNIISFTSA